MKTRSILTAIAVAFAMAAYPYYRPSARKAVKLVSETTVVVDSFKPNVGDKEAIPNRVVGNYVNTVTANEPVRKTATGVMIVGTGANVRAMEPFGGTSKTGTNYARIANKYQSELGDDVQVYCMPIPTAAAFYTPDKAKQWSRSAAPTFNNIFAHLDPKVKAVDIYTVLGKHAAEPIYSRTDHHWAPLGGYYAARKLAKVAGVPFRDLSAYTKKVVHRYVGTMYGFSKDPAVKNAPEDFIYYVPNQTKYTTTYINYGMRRQRIVSTGSPVKGKYFFDFKDGSSGAYCTFMGGDSKITKVETEVNNGRRVLIMKDSFGNAVPGYLFYSFEEVHVIDSRYFNKNLKKYVADNKITDVVFANNVTHASSAAIVRNYERFLVQ
jgi:hypothetical protein